MGSYKLYVAVMAIATIAAVQEIGCVGEDSGQYYDQDELYDGQENDLGEVDDDQGEVNIDQEEVTEPEVEHHHQCEEYKSKIWENALSNPKAMQLVELTFQNAKELASDEVCSDTTRSFLSFFDVMSTSPHAHYSLGMMNKMLAFILREVDTTSDKFKETKAVFERIVTTPEIRDYLRSTIAQLVDLFKAPEMRGRMFNVVKAFEGLMKPSEDAELIKEKIKGIRNAPAKMARGAINKVGSLFRRFQ